MNFDLDDEQILLSDTVDRLFLAHAAASPRDAAAEWQAYCDLGLLALPFPASLGGLDAGNETIMLVMEAFGRTLGQAPFLQSVLLAGSVLALAGGDTAHHTVAQIVEGQLQAALCLFEPGARYRWDDPKTSAVRTADGWTLDGGKVAVLDAAESQLLVCPAKVEGGLGLFVIPVDTPGVLLRTRPTPDGRTASDIVFSGVKLSASAAVGDVATNRALIATAIDGAIAACCAEAVGAMDQLLRVTVEYLNTRSQFGVAIGTFQALQHRAADMLVALEQARSITFYAVSMLDAPADARGAAVAAAKALVNQAARFVGSEAIQLHGGMGLAADYPAGRYFQRLTVIETMFGDTEEMLSRVA